MGNAVAAPSSDETKPAKVPKIGRRVKFPDAVNAAIVRQAKLDGYADADDWIIAVCADRAGMKRKPIVRVVGHEYVPI